MKAAILLVVLVGQLQFDDVTAFQSKLKEEMPCMLSREDVQMLLHTKPERRYTRWCSIKMQSGEWKMWDRIHEIGKDCQFFTR